MRDWHGRLEKGHGGLRKKGTPNTPTSKTKSLKAMIAKKKMQVERGVDKLEKRIAQLERELAKEKEDKHLLAPDPTYKYSFHGYPLVSYWLKKKRISMYVAIIMQKVSYHKILMRSNLKKEKINIQGLAFAQCLEQNIIQRIIVPTTKTRKRIAFILGTKGIELEQSFEKFFEEHRKR